MGFGSEVEAMRSAWQRSGFHAAKALITDRLFDGVPLIAATSVEEVRQKIRPYADAGATRIILPYVPSSDNVVEEMERFITAWGPT
jgi:hypothetical protein